MDKLKENIRLILIVLIIVLIPVTIGLLLKKDDGGTVIKQKYELKNYGVNEIIPVYITDEEIAKKYFTEYMTLLVYEPHKAFMLLDEDTLYNKFKSENEFLDYRNNLISQKGFTNVSVKNYSMEFNSGKNILFVNDSIGNEYGFVINGIMDYRVKL